MLRSQEKNPNTAEKNPNVRFDLGFLAVGAVLVGLLLLAVKAHLTNLKVVDVMTIALWMSVGGAMVISRFNQGRWE